MKICQLLETDNIWSAHGVPDFLKCQLQVQHTDLEINIHHTY